MNISITVSGTSIDDLVANLAAVHDGFMGIKTSGGTTVDKPMKVAMNMDVAEPPPPPQKKPTARKPKAPPVELEPQFAEEEELEGSELFAKQPAKKAKAAKLPDPGPETETSNDDGPGPEITKQQVLEMLQKVSKAKGFKQAQAILLKHGSARISDIPEDKWADILDECAEALL